jgi:P-type Cu2+ transporter
VGSRRLMTTEGIDLGDMGRQRDQLAAAGRKAVLVAVDGRAAGVIAPADAPRETSAAAVRELLNIHVLMLTGDNEATARRIADQLGIDTVIAEVLPADKIGKDCRAPARGQEKGSPGWATA